ncbi:MAG: hypothetical protein ACLGHT_07595 [Acidimicrobiia bacterium]
MVVADRRPRRSRSLRLLVFAALLTLAVLIINAIARNTGGGPDPRVTYLDVVRPMALRSTQNGADLNDLKTRAGTLESDALERRLEAVEKEARAIATAVRAVDAPEEVRADHGLLVTATEVRADAIERFETVLREAVGPGANAADAVEALVAVGDELLVADKAYALFVERAAKGSEPSMPPGEWVGSTEDWARPELAAFLATLRAGQALAPVADVGIITFTTDPDAVGVEADSLVIPLTRPGLGMSVVVANMGNQRLRQVTVEIAVTVADGTSDTARNFVDLDPGQRATVEVGNVRLVAGPATLTVRLLPVEGETSLSDNEQSRGIIVR